MKKISFSLVFFFGLILTALFINPSSSLAAANLQFVKTQVCYNGTLSLDGYPYYCYGYLYTANWRFRYRISNTGNQKGSGTVCYSDSSVGSGSAINFDTDCRRKYSVTVNADSFIDVNDTVTLNLCKWAFLGLHQQGMSYNSLSDRDWLSLTTPCSR